jgi:hypothetical protein
MPSSRSRYSESDDEDTARGGLTQLRGTEASHTIEETSACRVDQPEE